MEDRSTHLDPDQLLAELSWLRRLARSLVGSAGVDEDLVQETWLAASQRGSGVSRAWLAGTLRKLAARWQRSESRLRRREGAVARPEGVDAESILERNEVLGVVLGELRRLDEPFRTALLILYQEGLSVREGARRMGIAEDTLRWRRREGIERLRRRLDSSVRLDWRAALVPLTALPSTGLVSGGAVGAAGSMALQGGFLMSWKLFSAALLAVLAVLFVALSKGDRVPAGLEARSDPSPAASIAQPPEAPLSEQAVQGEPPRRVETVSPLAAEALPAPQGGNTLAVAVFDDNSSSIPGARVWVGRSPDPNEGYWLTDERGVATLPLPEGPVIWLSASTETHYGQSPVVSSIAGGEAEIVLFPDADVRVQVVDRSGLPVAGVPVSVGGRGLESELFASGLTAVTDGAGQAELRHVLDTLKFNPDSQGFSVGAVGLFRNAPRVFVSREDIPTQPVRVVLPPFGQLDISVWDAQGELRTSATQVNLAVDSSGGLAVDRRDMEDLVRRTATSVPGTLVVSLEAGRAHLPLVEVGLDVVAHAPRADAKDSTFGVVAGPRSAGETVELALHPLVQATEITGEVRDVRGELLLDATLRGGVTLRRAGTEYLASERIHTDASGRFRFAVADDTLGRWGAGMGFALRLDHDEENPLALSRAWTALPGRIESGENDVGTLRLEALEPTFTGTARDLDGEDVTLTHAFLVMEGDVGRANARALSGQVFTAFGGAFAIFVDPLVLDPERDESLTLIAGAQGLPRQRIDVRPSEQGLAIVFDRGGELHGRVSVGPGQSAQALRVGVFSVDERGRPLGHGWAHVATNGTFELDALPLTPCELQVRAWGGAKVLARLPDVLPGSDSAEQQERLDTIRIGQRRFEYRLHVVDPTGADLSGAAFRTAEGELETAVYGAAYLSWWATDESLTGELWAPGYRSRTLELSPGEQTATLRHGPEIVLWLADPPVVETGGDLVLVLSATNRNEVVELIPRGDGSHFGFVSGAGTYRVRARFVSQGRVLVERPLSDEGEVEIEVAERVETQEFELR